MWVRRHRHGVAVGGLTVLAFALRAAGLDQSLFGDELFTYDVVTHGSLGDMLAAVRDAGENSPPLFFVAAWVVAKPGDPTVTMRLPSLVFGTAAVPLTYLLGARTVGRQAGVLGAAFLALAPFAIFYSTEARGYALLVFLVVASTIALLSALDHGGSARWAAYVALAVCLIYTHYTGSFALLAQLSWALLFHRERARATLLAGGAIAAAWLPYLPFFLDQRDRAADVGVIEAISDFTPSGVATYLVRAVASTPYLPLSELPGRIALVLLGVGAATAAGVAYATVVRWQGPRTAPPAPGIALVTALALAPPIALLVLSLIGTNVFIPRYLNAWLPGLVLLVAALLVRLPRLAAAGASACVLAGLGIGAVEALEPEHEKPPLRSAAELIEERAVDGDPILRVTVRIRAGPLSRDLDPYFDHPHRVYFEGVDEHAAWTAGARAEHVFVVSDQTGLLAGFVPRPPPELRRRFRLVYRRFHPAPHPIAVFVYRNRAQA